MVESNLIFRLLTETVKNSQSSSGGSSDWSEVEVCVFVLSQFLYVFLDMNILGAYLQMLIWMFNGWFLESKSNLGELSGFRISFLFQIYVLNDSVNLF